MQPTDKKSKAREWLSIIVSGLCVGALIVGAMMLMPTKVVAPEIQHGVSNTGEIATKLQAYFKEAEKAGKNETSWIDGIDGIFNGGLKGEVIYESEMMDAASPNAGASTGSGTTSNDDSGKQEYIETTDNQVEGVIEADKIKRSDKYIFYLSKKTIQIFDINKTDTKKLGEFTPKSAALAKESDICEFYLSKDCKTINMVVQYTTEAGEPRFDIVNIDITDPANIKENKTITATGTYDSSRFTDDQLLVVSEFVVEKDSVDYEKEGTFIPQTNASGEMASIDCAAIVVPEKLTSTKYVVIMNLNPNTLEVYGQKALLSYLTDIYATKDHLYLARTDYIDASKGSKTITQIECFEYNTKEIKSIGSVTVDGYIKDQWSMDEYDGIFRIVTTTNTFDNIRGSWYDSNGLDYNLMRAWGDCNADLYCVDTKTWEVVGSVKQFAPPHEEVQSVRFDKTNAYVCTSIEMSDPVFFFDLSDVKNITYKETGTIEGYSSSLVNFGEGYLVGIGVENWSDFKIEVYEETDTDVKSVCTYKLKNTDYSLDYKSYYIDRENQIIGLGIDTDKNYMYDVDIVVPQEEGTAVIGTPSIKPDEGTKDIDTEYIVLRFYDRELNEEIRTYLDGSIDNMRGVYIDGYMYMFAENEFKVEALTIN